MKQILITFTLKSKASNINPPTIAEDIAAGKDETPSDFTIAVQDQKLQVHSQLLSLRFSVFRVMLNQDGMKEVNERKLEITDFDVTVVSNFISFLYSDTCDILATGTAEQVLQLVAIAHKYNVRSLLVCCEKVLIEKHLSGKGTAEILEAMTTFNLAQVQAHVLSKLAL